MRASCGMVGVMRVMLIARHAAQPSCVMLFMFFYFYFGGPYVPKDINQATVHVL